jgi:hypothetical protein
MSRDLPITPNLEHLRKQAKHRLAEMQRENPALQLADAQHARRHVDRERRALAAASAQSVSQRDDARRGRR